MGWAALRASSGGSDANASVPAVGGATVRIPRALARASNRSEDTPAIKMNALIVSFPKSGRTWLICLIAQFLANGTCAQSASDGYLKTHGIWYNHGEFMFNRGQHPYKGR